MEDLAKLGLLLTCVLAIYVGVRTLFIARRTRHFAELSIGANVLSLALGAMVLSTYVVMKLASWAYRGGLSRSTSKLGWREAVSTGRELSRSGRG